MKKLQFLLYLLLLFAGAYADNNTYTYSFYVKDSLRYIPDDLTPRTYPKRDKNGDYCAFLYIKCTLPNLHFSSKYMVDPDSVTYKNGVYTIYMTGVDENVMYTTGAKEIKVSGEGIREKTFKFSDYGIDELEGQKAYEMTIATHVDNDYGHLLLETYPQGADVYVGDSLIGQSPLSIDLPVGETYLTISMKRHTTEHRFITIRKDLIEYQQIVMNIDQIPVHIQTDPQTSIYFDNRLIGTGSFDGDLPVGQHNLSLTHRGLKFTNPLLLQTTDVEKNISYYLLGSVEKDYSKSNIDSTDADTAFCVGNCMTDEKIPLSGNITDGLSGEYKVFFRKNGYWTKKTTIQVQPTSDGKKNIAKVPVPKMYRARPYFLLSYQYSPKADAGLMIGLSGRAAGGYISGRYNIGHSGFTPIPAEENVWGINSFSVDGGLLFRFCQEMFLYMGIGYGSYESSGEFSYMAKKYAKTSGLNAEAGFIFNMHGKRGKGFSLTFGYNTQADLDFIRSTSPQSNIVVGIGMLL